MTSRYLRGLNWACGVFFLVLGCADLREFIFSPPHYAVYLAAAIYMFILALGCLFEHIAGQSKTLCMPITIAVRSDESVEERAE